MSHITCKRIFRCELQLSSYWQGIKFSRNCSKFHIFTKIVIFKVQLETNRPTASTLKILRQGHVRNLLFFHFRQLWAIKKESVHICNVSNTMLQGLLLPAMTTLYNLLWVQNFICKNRTTTWQKVEKRLRSVVERMKTIAVLQFHSKVSVVISFHLYKVVLAIIKLPVTCCFLIYIC